MIVVIDNFFDEQSFYAINDYVRKLKFYDYKWHKKVASKNWTGSFPGKRSVEFFAKETRDLYLGFGMPYKHIVMLYGVPGSGKTSTISAIASHFDCDIYTVPITKELTDYGLIDAFSYVNDKDDRKRIIVLEDIDCIFDTTRKEGDEHNMITLQSLLNCLDGHTCVEGTLLFMTANNPEKMDYAMIRSCRIDYKLELGYADEYQTKNIFNTFLPDQESKFKQF